MWVCKECKYENDDLFEECMKCAENGIIIPKTEHPDENCIKCDSEIEKSSKNEYLKQTPEIKTRGFDVFMIIWEILWVVLVAAIIISLRNQGSATIPTVTKVILGIIGFLPNAYFLLLIFAWFYDKFLVNLGPIKRISKPQYAANYEKLILGTLGCSIVSVIACYLGHSWLSDLSSLRGIGTSDPSNLGETLQQGIGYLGIVGIFIGGALLFGFGLALTPVYFFSELVKLLNKMGCFDRPISFLNKVKGYVSKHREIWLLKLSRLKKYILRPFIVVIYFAFLLCMVKSDSTIWLRIILVIFQGFLSLFSFICLAEDRKPKKTKQYEFADFIAELIILIFFNGIPLFYFLFVKLLRF